MEIDRLFFRLYSRKQGGEPRFAGSAFPVTPNGGFLTCRHVADVGSSELFVHDNVSGDLIPVASCTFSRDPALDLAFVTAPIPRSNHSHFPLLDPKFLLVGESVSTYGFFAIGGPLAEVERGYFAGSIINFTRGVIGGTTWSLTLPYPIIEGMSGSPVITYHNGPKVVGLAYGNRSTRILASEVIEQETTTGRTREAIHRIVEFGLAYHVNELNAFLSDASAEGFVVTADRPPIDGLE